VLVAPVLPMITDGDEHLDRLLGKIAAAGAASATVFALHLRPGAREWFWRYLKTHQPQLLGAYAELYRGSAYVLRSYAEDLARRVRPLLRRHRLDGSAVLRAPAETDPPRSSAATPATSPAPAPAPASEPTLF
jgi:DNA repair photolyase